MNNPAVAISDIDERLRKIEDLHRAGALGQALALCKDLIAEQPRAPEPLRLAAAISRDSGRPELALTFLERAASLDPARVDIHCERARLLDRSGDTAGAMAAYRRALEADAVCIDAHVGMAGIHEKAERSNEAVYHLDLAVALDPDNIDARNRLAKALDAVGDQDRAATLREETMRRARRRLAEEYRQVRSRVPNTPIYMNDQHRLSWAHALLTYASSATGLAKYYESRNDGAGAVRVYRDALRLLADAAEQASSVDGLRRTFETASQAFAHCHYEMALLAERRGDTGGAVYHLEEAMRARRPSSPAMRDKLGEVALRCGDTVAEIRAAVEAYHGKMPPPATLPVTRWDFRCHAAKWLDAVARLSVPVESARRRQIAVMAFTAYHIQLFFAVACALVARGHAVDFVWLPGLDFDRKSDPEPRYDAWDERLLAREMTALGASELPPGLRLIDLRTFAAAPTTPEMEAAAQRQALIDVRNHFSDASIDGSADPFRTYLENRRLTNLYACRRCITCFGDRGLDHVVLFNAGIMEYGAAFHAARQSELKVVEWEQSAHRRGAYLISINRCHGDLDVGALWRGDEPHRLTATRRDRVLTWLASKGAGEYRDPKPRGRLRVEGRAKAIVERLGLDPTKPVAALFPNLTWDTAVLDRDVAFPSVRDWVLRTAEFFERHPEWQLVVRIHPHEKLRTREFIGELMRRHWPVLPPNMRVIEAEDSLSSYRLLDGVQLGLYYTSTIGLEMAMFGIHAITPARPLYAGLGFTREAGSADTYFGAVTKALVEPDTQAVTEREIALAWCFADLYMNDGPKALPWSYQKFWPSIVEDWPMERVLSPEGRERFDKVFSVFGGEIDFPDGIVGRLG